LQAVTSSWPSLLVGYGTKRDTWHLETIVSYLCVVPTSLSQDPPRRLGRPRSFKLTTVLHQAIAVFSERGYSGASISHLVAATGLTAGSLYKAFPDKQALFQAAFAQYIAQRNDRLAHLLAHAPTGRERIYQTLLFYAESSLEAEGLQGCLILSSALSLSVAEPEVATLITQALHASESRLLAFVTQGQQDGSIAPTLDGVTTARLLLCVLQGMRIIGKTGRTRPQMLALVTQAMHLLS
jgi:TetR/AcrR family transcriptional repressor of nem operon